MTKFRDHKGSLSESMKTVQEFKSKQDLIDYARNELSKFSVEFEDCLLRIRNYGYDKRTGWNTHIVVIEGYGVFGFTDGPL